MHTLAGFLAEVDGIADTMRAAGYDEPHVKVEYGVHDWPTGRWTGYAMTNTAAGFKSIGGAVFAHQPQELLDKLRAAVDAAGPRWSAADVAATIGLPICESCDEAVATTWLHDDTYVELTGPGPRVCEPCLERAHDRQVERAMEG